MGNIGVVRDSSHGRSESLRLGGGPVLSLVGLRHRLVRHLSGSTVDRGSSMHHGGSNHRSMVGRASNSSHGDSLRVGSSAIIGHISNIPVDGVSVVVDMLDPAVRESHRVGALSIASSITGLSSIEVGVGVVISNSIVVGVRRDLISINLSNSMGNWSMVSRGSNHGSMVSRGSMGNDWGMGHNTCHTASMGNVGVVRDSSH